MRTLTTAESEQVTGGQISGYQAAGAIMAVTAFGSLFTPIGPVTAGIAIGSTGGIAAAQLIADLEDGPRGGS